MKTESYRLRLRTFIPAMLLTNLIIILLICLVKGQLQFHAFFKYMYYASLINMVIGLLTILGSLKSRERNIHINYDICPNQSREEMSSEEGSNRSNSLFFTIGIEVVGALMLIVSMLFNK